MLQFEKLSIKIIGIFLSCCTRGTACFIYPIVIVFSIESSFCSSHMFSHQFSFWLTLFISSCKLQRCLPFPPLWNCFANIEPIADKDCSLICLILLFSSVFRLAVGHSIRSLFLLWNNISNIQLGIDLRQSTLSCMKRFCKIPWSSKLKVPTQTKYTYIICLLLEKCLRSLKFQFLFLHYVRMILFLSLRWNLCEILCSKEDRYHIW